MVKILCRECQYARVRSRRIGGIDSALTSTLCAKTGLAVLCLEMNIHQEKEQVSRAHKHIKWLKNQFPNVTHHSLDLSPIFDAFTSSMPATSDQEAAMLSLANTRARFRMSTLYYFAALHRYLVAGTGNKVEDFGVGFYTKYGDGGVDLSPIADLMKSEVYALAKNLGVNQDIQQAAPTDGLWGDLRNDEDQLALPMTNWSGPCNSTRVQLKGWMLGKKRSWIFT